MTSEAAIYAHLDDNIQMSQLIQNGIPAKVAVGLSERFGITLERLATIVHIPKRTLHRRLHANQRLKQDESERVWRVMRLYKRAEEVFESESRAREWFNSHPKALGGKTPLEFAETEPGAREVEALLGRIEHGVFY